MKTIVITDYEDFPEVLVQHDLPDTEWEAKYNLALELSSQSGSQYINWNKMREIFKKDQEINLIEFNIVNSFKF